MASQRSIAGIHYQRIDELNKRYDDQFLTEVIDTYSKELIFSGGNSSLLSDMKLNFDGWNKTQHQLQNMKPVTWLSSKWYWVIAFAAAIRITKICGEIMNDIRQRRAANSSVEVLRSPPERRRAGSAATAPSRSRSCSVIAAATS